jgi:hypothetical protein
LYFSKPSARYPLSLAGAVVLGVYVGDGQVNSVTAFQ